MDMDGYKIDYWLDKGTHWKPNYRKHLPDRLKEIPFWDGSLIGEVTPSKDNQGRHNNQEIGNYVEMFKTVDEHILSTFPVLQRLDQDRRERVEGEVLVAIAKSIVAGLLTFLTLLCLISIGRTRRAVKRLESMSQSTGETDHKTFQDRILSTTLTLFLLSCVWLTYLTDSLNGWSVTGLLLLSVVFINQLKTGLSTVLDLLRRSW